MLEKVNQETIQNYMNKNFKEMIEQAKKEQEKIVANFFDIGNTQEPGQEQIFSIEHLNYYDFSLKDINKNIEKHPKFIELEKIASKFEDLDEDDVETVIIENFVSILNEIINFFAINREEALKRGYKLDAIYNTNTHRKDYFVETTTTYDMTQYKKVACYNNRTRFCLNESDYRFKSGIIYYNPTNEQIIEEKSRSELIPQYNCYSRIKRTVEICKEDIQMYEQEYNFEILDKNLYNNVLGNDIKK